MADVLSCRVGYTTEQPELEITKGALIRQGPSEPTILKKTSHLTAIHAGFYSLLSD